MKKIISIILVMITAVILFSGCSKPVETPLLKVEPPIATDIISSVAKNDSIASVLPDSVKSAGKITIGVDDTYPPMEYRDDKNALVGFDVDLGNAIGKKLGVNIEWVPTAFSGILPALQAKKFDMVMSTLSITDERKKEIGFSEPYLMGGPVIVCLTGNTAIKSSDDFKGKVIGVQLGTTGEEAVNGLTGIKEVKKYDKITDALLDLAAKRTEAVVADDQVGRYYIGLDSSKYAVVGKMADEPYGIGFRKDDTVLIDTVQKAINDLKADGTLSKISLKWFNTDYYKK